MDNRDKEESAALVERIRNLPVLGVCGFSGSGKTTLLEAVLPRLLRRNLKIAVVKHDVHGIDVDRPGKDSDRFFKAGADVFLQGDESLIRLHTDSDRDLYSQLAGLAPQYDLILVEGHKQSPLTKVWLLHEDEENPPSAITDIRAVLPRTDDRLEVFLSFLIPWLTEQWHKTPVVGCVIGPSENQSEMHSEMISVEQLRHTAVKIKTLTSNIIFLGISPASDLLNDGIFLPATPDNGAPYHGLAAAMRWRPFAAWLVVDARQCRTDILQDLLAARKPGVWAVVQRQESTGNMTMFSAILDFRCQSILEKYGTKSEPWNQLLSHPKTILVG